MSVTIPGTNIVVDHFKDRTWREEFFCEHGTDYTAKIWRERVGFADAEETEVVYKERADIPAGPDPDNASTILAGKPRAVLVAFSELTKWDSIPLDVIPGQPTLDDIGPLIIQSNEIVSGHNGQRRILDYQFQNGLIDEATYEAGLAALIVTRDA